MYMFYNILHRKYVFSTYTDTHYFYIICYVHVLYILMNIMIKYLENGGKLNTPLLSFFPGKNRGDIIC